MLIKSSTLTSNSMTFQSWVAEKIYNKVAVACLTLDVVVYLVVKATQESTHTRE